LDLSTNSDLCSGNQMGHECASAVCLMFVQMPSTGDWMGTLGRSGPMGEIPCRRMRSGSYVKAMADLEDSDDSDESPKPSPKSTARRQSYLRATQQSLTACGLSLISCLFSSLCDPRSLAVLSCLPSLREYSGNRSLDNLDCIGGSSPFPNWDDDDFSQGCSTLGRGSCISQVRPLMTFEDELEDMHPHSRCSEPPDMPMPTCFRSRSHSYLRAIQAGCSQDDDTASMDSDSPPPTTTTTVRTYSNSTGEYRPAEPYYYPPFFCCFFLIYSCTIIYTNILFHF
uniref:Discs, large (Drosophila) homolog-associated protein 4b n=1 Tax=Sinocyclocheilus grahami TaxID=75366 RepID=A0A672N5I1_SINGR